MIKKHLTTAVCLAALSLVNFYSIFELLTFANTHPEGHLFHQSLTGILTLIFLATYFRKQLFQKKGKFIQLRGFAAIFLVIFAFAHLAPANLNFAYHHQAQSQDGSEHPCCVPQVTVVSALLQFEPISSEYAGFYENSEKAVSLSLLSINNKSPPLS